MIHVVNGDNQHFYARQLDEMFRMRHRFYVEGHKWKDLHSVDGRETDEFDNEDAVYLMALDKSARVAAAIRLNPTMGPNLLADKLPHFAQDKPPRSPEIWDMTRWIVAERYRRSARKPGSKALRPGEELNCGLLEYALSRGIAFISEISESKLTPLLDQWEWKYWPLGPEIEYEDGKGSAQALLLEISLEQLLRERARVGLTDPVLFEMKPSPSEATPAGLRDDMLKDALSEQLEKIETSQVQSSILQLAQELAETVSSDPAAATATIHAFPDLLSDRLNQLASLAESDEEEASQIAAS